MVNFEHGMVVAAQPEAIEAGAAVLRAGGNAVDAAIAVGLVAGVVDPQMCGIAGFGNLQVYLPSEGTHRCIDFHATSPAATRPDQWEDLIVGETRDGFGFVLEGAVNDVGYQSIATPGALRAYFEAQTQWGTMDWDEIVAPAIAWAEQGFVVRPEVAGWWVANGAAMGRTETETRLRHSASGRALYFRPDGTMKRIGDVVVNHRPGGHVAGDRRRRGRCLLLRTSCGSHRRRHGGTRRASVRRRPGAVPDHQH